MYCTHYPPCAQILEVQKSHCKGTSPPPLLLEMLSRSIYQAGIPCSQRCTPSGVFIPCSQRCTPYGVFIPSIPAPGAQPPSHGPRPLLRPPHQHLREQTPQLRRTPQAPLGQGTPYLLRRSHLCPQSFPWHGLLSSYAPNAPTSHQQIWALPAFP